VKNLIVEVDTKYLKGMLNNPDIQPNTTINQWIAGILLFDFKLVHVPIIHHIATSVLHRYGYTRRFCTGTAMGIGTGTRILTHQIFVPVAVPVTKKLDLIIHSTDTPTI
jgi:hypothetical protein